jgi:hypothetical protein
MKKLIIFLLFVFINAEVLDRVVARVNNIPITSYEIDKLSTKMNIPKSQALNMLIDQKLIKSEIQKRGIEVDDFDIENAMEKIAQRNGLSLFEFKNILMQRGQYKQFVKGLKEELQKQKLFNQIVQTKLKISDKDIKNYYETHKKEFTTFKTIQVTKYTANTPEALKKLQQNPLMNFNIEKETKVYSSDELPTNLMFLFSNTKTGSFTPIINDGLGYSTYYIARKDGSVLIPYDKVKNIIANKLIAQKREMILKDYFSKLKNRADIKVFN